MVYSRFETPRENLPNWTNAENEFQTNGCVSVIFICYYVSMKFNSVCGTVAGATKASVSWK